MPRNAAQLRADAIATGWFDGPHLEYVGDGFSVPYQYGLPLGSVVWASLYAYKAYLDANVPEAARLHDWLFTPYGPGLIGCTQDEADQALREEVSAFSPADGENVFFWCQTFGAPYFGQSTVGYVPPLLPPGGDNIGGAPPGRLLQMADYKVVMLLQQRTTPTRSSQTLQYAGSSRTAGWSESFYVANTSIAALQVMLKGPRTAPTVPPILPARATCLPQAAQVLGARVYESGVGRGTFLAATYPGTWTLADVPSSALLCQTTSTASINVRRFTMRGIPDDQVQEGEFAPTPEYVTQIKTYFDSLTGTAFRGRLPSPTFEIFDITENGLATLRTPHAFNLGQFVTVYNSVTEEGNRRGGEYRISAVGPTNTQLTLQGWLWGATTGGTLTQPVYGLVPVEMGATSAVRISGHKVGRPFFGYRGRKSKARKTS